MTSVFLHKLETFSLFKYGLRPRLQSALNVTLRCSDSKEVHQDLIYKNKQTNRDLKTFLALQTTEIARWLHEKSRLLDIHVLKKIVLSRSVNFDRNFARRKGFEGPFVAPTGLVFHHLLLNHLSEKRSWPIVIQSEGN